MIIAICYPLRDTLADPVTAIIGTGLVSVLLLSSLWQLLTEGGPTRGDSGAFPRPSRVLFFLGYQLLWVTLAALVALTRDSRLGDLVPVIDLGDRVLGTTLLVTASLGLLTVGLAAGPRAIRSVPVETVRR